MAAALDVAGLAFLPEDGVLAHTEPGRLLRVLDDGCPPFPGYHLYGPCRRKPSPVFALIVNALRFRGRTLFDVSAKR